MVFHERVSKKSNSLSSDASFDGPARRSDSQNESYQASLSAPSGSLHHLGGYSILPPKSVSASPVAAIQRVKTNDNRQEEELGEEKEEAIQRVEIANIASGTDEDTLMHGQGEGDNVTNIDTGHMAISDAVIEANDPAAWRVIAQECVKYKLFKDFPKGLGNDEQKQTDWLEAQMAKTPSNAAARLKSVLSIKNGLQGALELQNLLPKQIQDKIEEKLQSLKGFKRGDLATFAQDSIEKGGTDMVHIVNALGFDPIKDPTQAMHLAQGIKPGGSLLITAEASGQSVASLIGKEYNRDKNKVQTFLDKEGADALKKFPLGQYFDLVDHVVDGKAGVMASDPYTAELTTRHTIKSGASTEMEDNIPTVRLTFVRNEIPVAKEAAVNSKEEEKQPPIQ